MSYTFTFIVTAKAGGYAPAGEANAPIKHIQAQRLCGDISITNTTWHGFKSIAIHRCMLTYCGVLRNVRTKQ